jgi:hypothetical protein
LKFFTKISVRVGELNTKRYYSTKELATKVMKEFIIQRCVEEYEYLLRRDLLSIWGGGINVDNYPS